MKRDRILIYRLGSLGDMLVALPAFHLIERAFPGAERRLLTNVPVASKAAPAAAVLGESGLVSGYFTYPIGVRNPFRLLALWWALLSWRPQVVVYLGSPRGVESAKRDAFFLRLCGIGRQIGVPVTDEMQQPTLDAETELFEPESERLLRNLAELGDGKPSGQAAWDLRLSEAERTKAQGVLAPAGGSPLLFFSLGTKVPVNDWGLSNWSEAMRALGSIYPQFVPVAIGAGEEREPCEAVLACWRQAAGAEAQTLNLCGLLSPRESAAALEHACLFVGHDSGPLHLASTVGARCVGIFSARNQPGRWFPYNGIHRVIFHRVSCMGCRLTTCTVEKMRCMRSITVDEVVREVCLAIDTSRVTGGERRGEEMMMTRRESHAS